MKKVKFSKKVAALTLATAILVGGVGGSTLAWLLDSTAEVTNTFTESGIEITLKEGGSDAAETAIAKNYKMLPGSVIEKDPKVTVKGGSEDCWLFIKITESTQPDLDKYIDYHVVSGWTQVEDNDNNADTIVIGRKVTGAANDQEFDIIGYLPDSNANVIPNKVMVKTSVGAEDMNAISGNNAKPTLAFKAYAVQLYKTNGVAFEIDDAWSNASQ